MQSSCRKRPLSQPSNGALPPATAGCLLRTRDVQRWRISSAFLDDEKVQKSLRGFKFCFEINPLLCIIVQVFVLSLSRGCSLVSLAHSSRLNSTCTLYCRRNSFFLFHVFASLRLRSFVLLQRFLIDSLLDFLCFVLCDFFFPYCRVLCHATRSSLHLYVAYQQPPIDLVYTDNNASAAPGQR